MGDQDDSPGPDLVGRGLGRDKEGNKMDVRRSGIVVCAALSAAVLWVAGPGASLAGAATGGGECQLQGVANLSPPLTSSSGNFAYNFTGMLSSCQSRSGHAPVSFTIASDGPTFAFRQQSRDSLPFSPTTQDQNCVTMGVSSANIGGTGGIGSAQ